jgi:multiple sugar transport system substrate-binding protein
MDLTDYLPKSEVAAENYNAKVWSMTDVNGGHYAVPLDYHSYITYVNMDLYEKYGNGALDDGYLTWDEIKASADAVVADNLIPIGLDWKGADWRSAYAQLGGTMSDDGVQPSIIDEDSIRVLTQWQELYEAGYTTQEGDSAWSLFLGGQLLYCTEGIWMYNNVKEAGLNAVMTEYPAFSETERGGWTSSHNFVIPKDDSRSEEEVLAALDFINFVGENSLEWAKAGQVPAHKSIIDNEEFQGMQQYFLTQNDDLIKMYDYKYYGYVNEALDKVYKEINYCRMTPEEGLQQAEQEVRDRISAEQ